MGETGRMTAKTPEERHPKKKLKKRKKKNPNQLPVFCMKLSLITDLWATLLEALLLCNFTSNCAWNSKNKNKRKPVQ